MATKYLPILGATLGLDASGDIYPSNLNIEMTLTNPKLQHCIVMEFPTGSDIGFELAFMVPEGYVGSPALLIKGVLDGTPSGVVLAFGAQQLSRADSENVDTAYEAEDLASNSTWTGYVDKDEYEEIITLTPAAAYQEKDTIYLSFFRDDSVDTTTFNFLLTQLYFQYADA